MEKELVPGGRLHWTDSANPIHIGKMGRDKSHAACSNGNFESLLNALLEERCEDQNHRSPLEELTRSKLLRETEFTTPGQVVRRGSTAFSASRH